MTKWQHIETEQRAFLIWPRIPETVLIEAPSNLLTSRSELNIPEMKAVFLYIFDGVPTSFNFFTICDDASNSKTTPVAAMRKPGMLPVRRWIANTPVFGGTWCP